jgi:SAM-dependent methyltransferase
MDFESRALPGVATPDSVPTMALDTGEPRRHAPATLRNREPIIAVLRDVLPQAGLVLEVASGTGEHAAAFAAAFPHLTWQPTDGDPAALTSIAAHAADSRLENIRPPLALDATAAVWPIARADALLCINMIHIAPWSAAVGLLAGAAQVLAPGGLLYLYGPFRRDGAHTAESNRRFDEDLRRRNPAWGVRDLREVGRLATDAGFRQEIVVAMPANNLSVVFRRTASA